MTKEVIILAGGLGTRLKDTVPDLPKCLAPVAGHPFLFFVISYLQDQGISRFVFSLGYKHEEVERYLESTFGDLEYSCVIENEPLQTGGAIKLAMEQVKGDQVFIMNGDTLFRPDLGAMDELHHQTAAECTIALKPMEAFDRYGAVVVDGSKRISAFKEKQFVASGLINAGIYLLNKTSFLSVDWPEVFSFEVDYLSRYCLEKQIAGYTEEAYFIDIGIPADFSKAQRELKTYLFPFHEIDESWTLFLDRDGVINLNKNDSYVFHRGEFIFKEGVLAAFPKLSQSFLKVIVVTNQRGIGRGMMTEEALADIHTYMTDAITASDGHIDTIFYCTATHDDHPDRKPNPGMALKAKGTYPEIDFSKSIVIGDKASDMKLGRNIGARTVLISSERYKASIRHEDVDLYCESLLEFSNYLNKEESNE